jgi:hypothetical protein
MQPLPPSGTIVIKNYEVGSHTVSRGLGTWRKLVVGRLSSVSRGSLRGLTIRGACALSLCAAECGVLRRDLHRLQPAEVPGETRVSLTPTLTTLSRRAGLAVLLVWADAIPWRARRCSRRDDELEH